MQKTDRNHIRPSVGDKTLTVSVILITALFALVVFIPLWIIVVSSFSDVNAVLGGRVSLWPVDFSLDGYKAVLSNKDVGTGYLNTLAYTVIGTIVNISVTMICAYPLTRRELPFAVLQSALDKQVQIAGRVGLRKRGGGFKTQARRNRHHHFLRHGNVFGVAASAQKRAHFVANLPAGDVFAHLADDAGYLQPHPRRPALGRGVGTGALQKIGAVQRRRVNFNHNLPRSSGGFFYVRPHKLPAGLFNQHGFHFHGSSSFPKRACYTSDPFMARLRPPSTT